MRAGFFKKRTASISAVTAASSVPSSLRASLLFPIAHSFTLLHDTLDCGTDAKSKLKFGVVVATIEQQVFICDGETAYRGMAARQSIDVGQVSCMSSSDR